MEKNLLNHLGITINFIFYEKYNINLIVLK
jgi:hypothetical protein